MLPLRGSGGDVWVYELPLRGFGRFGSAERFGVLEKISGVNLIHPGHMLKGIEFCIVLLYIFFSFFLSSRFRDYADYGFGI